MLYQIQGGITMRKLIPFFLSLLLLAGCATPAEQEPSYRQISMDEAIAMMEENSSQTIAQP